MSITSQKLVLYAEGERSVHHKYASDNTGVIATLIVQLPSSFTDGALQVHRGAQQVELHLLNDSNTHGHRCMRKGGTLCWYLQRGLVEWLNVTDAFQQKCFHKEKTSAGPTICARRSVVRSDECNSCDSGGFCGPRTEQKTQSKKSTTSQPTSPLGRPPFPYTCHINDGSSSHLYHGSRTRVT